MRAAGRTGLCVDISLRARVRAGDPAAFGQIFDAYARVVYRHAVRWTGDWAAAEDVVSLTFLEAWRLRKKLRPGGESLQPWLLGIATNVLRNTARAARRHQKALIQLPLREAMPDFAEELVGRLADTEQLAAAKAALERLRPAEREVFALCVWSGLEHAAVAEALGVPVGTVRSRLSRARSRLRQLTEQELARVPENMQRDSTSGQIPGDRASAVRSKQEKNR
ncbi:RNA polymerase sigma factor [Streptomyces sp. NPDC052013]|uniref:RNA polymerase sigma factor n=1 Tax=Streptomyces sp. NPDC052013 TaxID=3365679 RepID=UPI0037D5E132